MIVVRSILCAALALAAVANQNSLSQAAPAVWTGPTISFTKPSGANHTLPANQDHLTANVALTRGNSQGMINILQEASFTSSSPADTLWATALNNPGDTIAAANWAALDFTTWAAAYGNNTSANILNYSAVVHLVSDDVYLDLQFTSFQGGGSGGAFAYQRSTRVPEPAAIALSICGSALLLLRRPRRR